jgi:hypothetical protein
LRVGVSAADISEAWNFQARSGNFMGRRTPLFIHALDPGDAEGLSLIDNKTVRETGCIGERGRSRPSVRNRYHINFNYLFLPLSGIVGESAENLTLTVATDYNRSAP